MTDWNNWREFELDGINFSMIYNTKRHIWQIHFGTISEGPVISFTKAKGDAVIKFLEAVQKEIENNAPENK